MELRYEIVRVLNDTNLIDSESYQRRYCTRDGRPLAAGHYVVLWDESVATRAFDECATYVGPYRSYLVADMRAGEILRCPPAQDAASGEQSGLRAAA